MRFSSPIEMLNDSQTGRDNLVVRDPRIAEAGRPSTIASAGVHIVLDDQNADF
jgi:hypothetical protein